MTEHTEEQKEKAAGLIRDMIRDESVMCVLMVGLVSTDNNLLTADRHKNLGRFERIRSGLGLVTPENGGEKERLEWIAGLIEDGIEILKRNEVLVPTGDRLEEILGPEVLYKVRAVYDSYFDPKAASEASRDRYILEKFGECPEPTYDPLWNVWYLGWYDEDLKLHYHVGPEEEIKGMYNGEHHAEST